MATLRQRTPATPNSPEQTLSPPLSPTTSASPGAPLRPTVTRSNTGTETPQYSIEEDELFSGLGLLDLLVLVDAHLELWGRGFRKKSAIWREKADRLATSSSTALSAKVSSSLKLPKLPLPKLPRVKSDALLERLALVGDHGDGTSQGHHHVLSKADKEKIEKAFKDVRGKLEVSMKRINRKWEEEKTVRLRDKVSFLLGVMNVLVSALLLGFSPEWIPFYYTAQVLVYLPLRIRSYKKRLFHYFLFDLCYAINLLCLVFLWILPGNPYLFEACYGLTLGSLGTAIATWRNSLVFHSLDKVISLAIHIFPPFVFTTIRHFYPNAEARYPALVHLKHLRPWRSIGINMVVYLMWQLLYYRYVIVARKEKIKQGRATSFTYLINDKKRLIGKIAAKVQPEYREAAFMLGQAIYTFITLLIPVFCLYESKFWSSVYLLVLFAVSVWNGGPSSTFITSLAARTNPALTTASFYLEVYSRRFEKELLALQKEFAQQQALLAELTQSPNATTAGIAMPGRSSSVSSPVMMSRTNSESIPDLSLVGSEIGEGEGEEKDSSSLEDLLEEDSFVEAEADGDEKEEEEEKIQGPKTEKEQVAEDVKKEEKGQLEEVHPI